MTGIEPEDIPYIDWMAKPLLWAGVNGLLGWALWDWWWQICLVFFWCALLHAVRFFCALTLVWILIKR